MLSLSKIKNKKVFFLIFIILSIFSAQCYGMEQIKETINTTLGIGTKSNPKHINVTITQEKQQQDPLYIRLAWTFGPAIFGLILTQVVNKLTEDSELTHISKEQQKINLELKKIEFDLKKHPDYPAIYLLQQKNDETEKANKNKEVHLTLEVQKAQLLEHYDEKIKHFLKCAEKGSSDLERRYCKDMLNQYDNLRQQLFSAQ